MRRNHKRILSKILIIIGVIAILGGAFAYIYLTTDMFKSGKQLFTKYLIQNASEISQIIPVKEMLEVGKKINENKYEETMTISHIEQDKAQPSSVVQMETQVDPVNKKSYASIGLADKVLDEQIKAEFMQDAEAYSLRFTDNVKQFLTIKNSNLKQLTQNMGMDEEITQGLPDEIDINMLELDKLKFTEEEKNKELAKYAMILFNNISNKNYTKNKDAVITINGRTVTTNSYTLTLNSQNIKDISIKILEEIKQSEVILQKIQTVDEMLKDFEIDSLKESFINVIDENITKLKEQTDQEITIKIIIYEENGKTVRIKLENNLDYITLDTTEIDGKKQIELNYVAMDELNTLTSSGIKIIKENDNKITAEIKRVEGEEQLTNNLQIELKEEENNTKITILYDNEAGQTMISRDINFVEEIAYKVTLDNSNNIVLNDIPKQTTENIFKQLEPMVTEKYLEPLEKIDMTTLYPALLSLPLQLGDIPAIIPIAAGITVYNMAKEVEVDFTEAERNLFNAKFELYQGENVSGTAVNALLATVVLNNIGESGLETGRYVTVSGITTIKAEDTTANKVDTSKFYKIECGYDENQLVNKIIITETGI